MGRVAALTQCGRRSTVFYPKLQGFHTVCLYLADPATFLASNSVVLIFLCGQLLYSFTEKINVSDFLFVKVYIITSLIV